MMIVASITGLPSSTMTGKRFIGQSSASSRMDCGVSGVSGRHSNGVAFSYSAISTFWQYDENGCA
ncbi:hypothetical protein GCM10010985_39890 [Caballeronia grimmiae]|uniref:Transposase n=1 Tax=Caballeronia grimmiae TaxID=1071679 RepID=A0ABQ1RTE6_9BURK|nr:hypothetical protein GCM10010985_39890 [Caballeronia grimmiae]